MPCTAIADCPRAMWQGRSGAGWVCPNKGTDEPACKFRHARTTGFVAEPDPFEDEEAEVEEGAVSDLG